MPVLDTRKPKTNTAPEVLNAIRNSASINYRNYVPYATPDAESVKAIGAVIMDNVALQNEFVNLINRIAAVYVSSKLYENPWSIFKKGELQLGETIEEVFLNLPTAHIFDPETAETEFMKREIPDVRAAFHLVNYQEFYKQTVDRDTLAHAFTSWSGVDDFIGRIVEGMSSAAAYDEFIMMKYVVALRLLAGDIKVDDATSEEAAIAMAKSVSNKFTFMGGEYNLAGVLTTTKKNEQFFIETAEFDAYSDVYTLAKAFNIDKVQFAGNRMLVDSFSFNASEMARLAKIFEGDSSYTPFSDTELAALAEVNLVILDRNFFMIFDKLNKMTEDYNGEGLYWNYWYHVWRIFSASPFANAYALTVEGTASGVTAVAISGSIPIGIGTSAQLTAAVTKTGFASGAVTWSSSNPTILTVDARGIVTRVASGTATITATSVYDPEISDTL